MSKEARDYLELQRRIATFKYAKAWGNVARACRTFAVPRASYYKWKKRYDIEGEAGLSRNRPIARKHPRSIPQETIDKVLELRTKYHLGPQRIVWYMDRYHGTKIAFSSVYRILVRHGVRRFPTRVGCRALHTCRYAKEVPGHHVQVDVKVLSLKGPGGKGVRRFQYTAIDDATRIRALQIYPRHNQANAITFIDYVLEKFPFRLHTIRTDRGHEFQALFHWHVEDKGIRHVYIKPRSPELNGKVERSHRSDGEEFYQLLSYTDDVDLNRKLAEWERFYNFDRPHGAHGGKTPYEALREMLDSKKGVSVA
ncbi:IS481 family transposase [candidate division GN15 bacterium]|uniref:IS481 family transposase n=1 Tax=candidate division GN15 bacterium TaxID=2072418 RepID=A0A855X6S1_9BACT|nr:MAG: IS481 family transposase [candidate division GN15 bacterium]